jgi:hypothetical protein
MSLTRSAERLSNPEFKVWLIFVTGHFFLFLEELTDHAFLKKLAILPCPRVPVFFPFAVFVGLAGAGLSFFGSASASEKDSQAASSLVTVHC